MTEKIEAHICSRESRNVIVNPDDDGRATVERDLRGATTNGVRGYRVLSVCRDVDPSCKRVDRKQLTIALWRTGY